MGLRDYLERAARTLESPQGREQREQREFAETWENGLRICHRCPTKPAALEPIGERCGGWPVWYMGLPHNRSLAFIPGVRLSGNPGDWGMMFTSSHIGPMFRDVLGPLGYDEDYGDRPFGYSVPCKPTLHRGLYDPPAGFCTPSRVSDTIRNDGHHCASCGLVNMASLHTCLWGEADTQPRWATMWFVQHGNGVASVVRFEDTMELLDFDGLAKLHVPQRHISVPESLWLPQGEGTLRWDAMTAGSPERMPRIDHVIEVRDTMPQLSPVAVERGAR